MKAKAKGKRLKAEKKTTRQGAKKARVKICPHCEEPILKGEAIMPMGGPKDEVVFHHECGFRLVAGSVGHIQKRCSCYGGTEGDPTGLTKREAALAALVLWRCIYAQKVEILRQRGEY